MIKNLGSIFLIICLIFLYNIANADKDLSVPYIHQVGDTSEDFDGRWACGATSAVMITASYNRIPSHPIDCSYCPPPHTSEYGWYVSEEYTLYGYTFDESSPTPTGTGYGAYGFIHNEQGYAIPEHARGYFRRHGLYSEVINNPTEGDVKAEVDKGHPVWASTNLWSSGHIVVIKGYTDDGYYIVNDSAPLHPDIQDKPPEERENLWFSTKEYHCYDAGKKPMFYSWNEMEVGSKWIVTADPIAPGDRVKALYDNIHVREEPRLDAADKGFVNEGDTGTILDDITYGCFHNADDYTWWKIQWDDGKEGWSACGDRGYGENWLEKIESLELLTIDQFLTQFKNSIAGEGTGLFVRLTDPDIENHFQNLLSALLASDLMTSQGEIEALNALGVRYKLVQLIDVVSPVYGFMERVSPGHPDYRGWGAFLIRPDAPGYTIYQAPHVKADMYTEDITLDAFIANENAPIAMFAGAHRNANGDSDGDGEPDSDVAHDTENLFHALTVFLANRGLTDSTPYWFVQIHGSSDRTSEPTIVGSDGADIPSLTASSPLIQIDDAVDEAGYVTMGVCGWFEGPGDDEDGDYLLCATTNVQGDFLETLGLRQAFMHFEIERSARDNYIVGSGPGYDGILSLLAAIANTLGDTHMQPPSPIPEHLVIPPPDFINTKEDFQAGNSITAGPVRIAPPGDVTFRAGNIIYLKPGFEAKSGSKFRALIDPELKSKSQ